MLYKHDRGSQTNKKKKNANRIKKKLSQSKHEG